jgi:hypothetical protein
LFICHDSKLSLNCLTAKHALATTLLSIIHVQLSFPLFKEMMSPDQVMAQQDFTKEISYATALYNPRATSMQQLFKVNCCFV